MRHREWSERLAEQGFRSRDGSRTWRRRGFVLVPEGRWARLRRTQRVAGDPLTAPRRPGPWKRHGALEVFDLPPCALGAAHVGEALVWALATAGGAAPAGWNAPSEQELASWITAVRLAVQSGGFAARARLVCAPDRLALEVVLGSGAPPPDSNRAAWLAALLADAEERWRLVRFALEEGAAPRAEVDLTGAPQALLEPLVQVAADALVEVARGLLAPIALLLDEGASSRAFETLSPSHP